MINTSLTGEDVERPIHFSVRIMSSSNCLHRSTLVAKFLLFLLFFCISTALTSSLQFEDHTFTESQAQDFVFYGEDARINGDALQTSLGRMNTPARILYKDGIRLWKGGFLSPFKTATVINIALTNRMPGEGLAFILTNSGTPPPDRHGQWLGIVNEDTDGSRGPNNHMVAVEFFTRMSYTDDLDDDHIGLDLNGVKSLISAPFLSSELEMM